MKWEGPIPRRQGRLGAVEERGGWFKGTQRRLGKGLWAEDLGLGSEGRTCGINKWASDPQHGAAVKAARHCKGWWGEDGVVFHAHWAPIPSPQPGLKHWKT